MQNERGFLDQIRFSQGLRLWRAGARSLGVIAGTIIFVLLGEAVAAVGSLAPVAILLTALLVVINSLGYAELAVGVARPGGAYTLIHEGLRGGGLAFLTGWALALSAVGLCSVLAQGAAYHLSLLLADLFGLTVPVGLLAMGLIALAALESYLPPLLPLSGEGWGGRLHFTLPLVFLLVVLALLAAPRLPSTEYAAVYPQPGPAMALFMAAFVGMEIITSRQTEIRRRTINTFALLSASLPRSLLGVPILAAALGSVLAAAVGAHAAEVTGAPLAPLGQAVAGATGRAMVLGLGLLVLTLSLERALTLAVRYMYMMSRDGFWPAWLRQVHPRRGVPIRLILLVSLPALLVVWIPIGLLSRVIGLLYLLTLMAVNLALALRPRPETPPPFALPFHPWIPALTLAVDLLVIPLWGLEPIVCTMGCLAVGGLVYLAYGRSRHIEAQEGVTVFHPPGEERAPEAFRVLVPIANPATAGTLLRTAGRLAQAQGGDVLALQVVVVPESVPLEAGRRRAQAGRALLEKALALANEEDLPVHTMTRVAHSVAQGILDTAAEEGADLILLGWGGVTHPRATSLGRIVDIVLRDASCDVLVVRGDDAAPPKKILVPTAGGPHAKAAVRLSLLLAEACEVEVTLLYVQQGPATPQQMEENRHRIAETMEGLSPACPLKQKVVQALSVVEGIVEEAQEHDLVLLGVSDESLLDRLVFGSVPLQVAARVPGTILVQGYRGITGLWTRRVIRGLLGVLPVLSNEQQLEVHRELRREAQPGINYFVMIVLSCIIAALGLLLNSPAVVIGAMLVAPLMSPIMAFSLGLVLGDLRLIRFSVEAIFKGVVLAVIITAFIGLLSPLKMVTAEMLARAQPNLLDMGVALASGMAGAYALARKDVSAALPGVAIAAALMPPLATVGLGLSLGSARVAGGAFLLFITNIAAISLAGGLVFTLLGIRPRRWGAEDRRRLRQRLIASFLSLLVIAIPLGVIMAGTVQDAAQERAVRDTLAHYLTAQNSRLVDLEIEHAGAGLLVVAVVHSAQPSNQVEIDTLAQELSGRLGRPVRLEVIVLPAIRSTP